MELRLLLLEAANRLQHANVVHSAVTAVLIAVLVVAALRPAVLRGLGSRACFYGLVVATIFWARLPGLLPPYLNPDEALFTAAARRLLDDPVFWRSVDTGSSGPLNVFPLVIPALFGLTLDLASSRLMGLVMITASVGLFYAAVARVYTEAVARLATLPVAVTAALVQYSDFVHLSSEHGPVLLLSGIFYLLCRMLAREGHANIGRLEVFVVGCCAGMMPYMKMQGVPLAAVLCLMLLHVTWTRSGSNRRFFMARLGWLAAGGVLPSVFAAAFLSTFSIWGLFWRSYLQTNLFTYANARLFTYADVHSFGIMDKMRSVAGMLGYMGDLHLVLATTLAVAAIAVVSVLTARILGKGEDNLPRPFRRYFEAYAIIYLVVAVWAVARPGNWFPHYLLFTLLPTSLIMAAALGRLGAAEQIAGQSRMYRGPFLLAIVVIVLGVSLAAIDRYRVGNRFLPRVAYYLDSYRAPVAETILSVAPTGSTMAVWGFAPNLFMESGLVQGNRYGCALWQIEENPLRDDFIAEYVADLEATRPLVFVDAMSPHMFYVVSNAQRPERRHDAFPSVAAYIREHYDFVAETRGVRVYLRKSAAAADRDTEAGQSRRRAVRSAVTA